MRDRELRASLAKIGPQQPGLEYAGQLVDGRRRQLICGELGIQFDVRIAHALEQACALLWPLHPARALELARSEGPRAMLQLAEMCGATPAAVARELAATKPKRSHHATKRLELDQARTSPRMLRRLVTLEPELYALAKRAANELGHRSFPRLVRDCLWRAVRDNVHDAPIHQPRRVQAPNGRRR
jgi:hypothetical protein